jgi:hypothetical protein
VASVLTLADAKTHLDITVATFDTELQDTIDEAESLISQEVGPLASTAVTATFVPGNGAAELVLPVTPAISLTSVTPNVGSALTVGLLSVTPWGTVRYTTTGSFGLFYAAWYTVVYQAGRATVPDGVLRGIKLQTAHLWNSQRGAGGRQSATQESTGPSGAFAPGVLEAIKNFRQAGFS